MWYSFPPAVQLDLSASADVVLISSCLCLGEMGASSDVYSCPPALVWARWVHLRMYYSCPPASCGEMRASTRMYSSCPRYPASCRYECILGCDTTYCTFGCPGDLSASSDMVLISTGFPRRDEYIILIWYSSPRSHPSTGIYLRR